MVKVQEMPLRRLQETGDSEDTTNNSAHRGESSGRGSSTGLGGR
jgi:hypothetical protein